jgi:hypothetical protein
MIKTVASGPDDVVKARFFVVSVASEPLTETFPI